MSLLSIFTPTYNRAYILSQLYKSLKKQTNHSFEWIIVDDGSTDNTEELVEGWKKENAIIIVYVRQENQGKHIAINTGVKYAKGELFFIVDSDDYVVENAVEKINSFWANFSSDESISGIISYRQFADGRLVGTSMPEDIIRCKLRDTARKYGSIGDKVVVYRTELMRRFPFPKFGQEKFLGESYLYDRIDYKYDMIMMRERLYIFAYQKDGLSQDFRRLYRNNPLGFLSNFEYSLFFYDGWKEQIKKLAHVVCLRLKTHSLKSYLVRKNFFLRFIAFPLGIILYLKIFVFQSSDVKPFVQSED